MIKFLVSNKSSFNSLLASVAAVTIMIGSTAGYAAETKEAKLPFTEDQRGAMEDFVRDFIMNNPEVLVESVNRMRENEIKKQDEQAKTSLGQYQDYFQNDANIPRAGNPKGDVMVVELFDYNCGYCKRAFEALQKTMDSDKNLNVVFLEYPILSPQSELASKWAIAANSQGKYWEYHKELMESNAPKTKETLADIAKKIGLDVARLKKDAESEKTAGEIAKNREIAQSLGVTGTPAFIIGDEIVRGYVEYEGFKAIIDEQRKASK